MKFLEQKIIIGLALLSSQFISSQTSEWFEDDFETVVERTTIDGKTVNLINPGYAVWYDGGSGAYQKDSEYMTGSSSYVITNPGEDGSTTAEVNALRLEKPYYGSIYTEVLDMSGHDRLVIDINHLFVNKNQDAIDDFFTGGNNGNAILSVQVSSDGGETFRSAGSITANLDNFVVGNKTLIQMERDICSANCGFGSDLGGLDGGLGYLCALACNNIYDIDDVGGKNWASTTIDLSDYISNMMVIRLKAFIEATDFDTEIYIDDVKLSCDDCYLGLDPELKFSKETIAPESDAVTSGRTLYHAESFNNESNDWGIWEDGGRNAYSTEFLASEGRGICLRNFYSGKSNGVDEITGEDLGYQKPTYSSIVTENLDFTEVQDLELAFSFVPYQMKIADPTDEELEEAGNTNLTDEDGLDVLGYVPGNDRVEISISTNSGIDYTLVKTLTYAEDFVNKQRYDLNVNIPGDITSSGRLTTTTKIKIQCFSDTDSQQFYIDDVSLYTIGSASSPEGSSKNLNWESYEQSYLTADASRDTYDVINSTYIIPEYYDDASFEGNNDATDSDDVKEKPGIYGAVEHSDCSRTDAQGNSIITEYNSELDAYVFNFNVIEDTDTDRCRTDGLYDDRQRIEIKTYSQSHEYQKAEEGETHYIAWKMKLPSGFEASDKFTHLHQLKPVGGENVGMPTITLTANGPKIDLDTNEETAPAQLNLRYSPSTVSQVTVTSVPMSELEGQWIQFLEKVTYGTENEGRYELLIYKNGDVGGTPLLDFKSFSFETWKGGDFVRPKWGIYRSIVQPDKIKDETLLFSDFVILEVPSKNDGLYGDLEDFGTYVQSLESETSTACVATAPTNLLASENANNTVTLSWDSTTANPSHYNVRYTVSGENNWTKIRVEGDINTLDLSDLTTGTTYEWQIRTICEDNSGSNYNDANGPEFTVGEEASDTTTCIATAPTDLTVTSDGDNIKLSWNITTQNSSHHNVRYKATDESTWTKIQVKEETNELTLTSLTENITYEWQVRAVCEDNSGSNYLDAEGPEFTTNGTSSKSTNTSNKTIYNLSKLYPNPTQGELNLNLTSIADVSEIKVKVYTLTGKEIEVAYVLIEDQNRMTLDTSKLKNGQYILKVTYKDSIDTMSFMKTE